jgi:replicative DNA helicase
MQNIEKSILSTILFGEINIDDLLLQEKHFGTSEHRDIFRAIVSVHHKELPLDSDFVLKELDSSYQDVLIDIYATTPIANIKAYEEQLIESYNKKEIQSSLLTLLNQTKNMSSLEAIENIKNRFDTTHINSNFIKVTPFDIIKEETPHFYLPTIAPIQNQEITIISASGGSGKSYIGAYIILKLIQNHNLKCLCWFSEDSIGITKKRFANLMHLHKIKIDTSNIALIGKEHQSIQFVKEENKSISIDEKFYHFKREFREYDVILLDPLIGFFGADENSNADARYFMSLLNKWCIDENKTIILIHHHSKGVNATARGASAFVDACRVHYTVNKIEDDNTSRELIIEKTNHYSSEKKKFSIKLFGEIKPKTKVINTGLDI